MPMPLKLIVEVTLLLTWK